LGLKLHAINRYPQEPEEELVQQPHPLPPPLQLPPQEEAGPSPRRNLGVAWPDPRGTLTSVPSSNEATILGRSATPLIRADVFFLAHDPGLTLRFGLGYSMAALQARWPRCLAEPTKGRLFRIRHASLADAAAFQRMVVVGGMLVGRSA
jgi:hypothetical protein